MIFFLYLRNNLHINLLFLLTFPTLNASANPYQAVCEKVANNDLATLEIIRINSPKDAKIDLNNDGVYDPVSCRRSSLSLSCHFDDGVSGEHIGIVTEQGLGQWDYIYEDIFIYAGKTFVRLRVGSDDFNAPERVSMYTGLTEKVICSISGEWTKNKVKWHKDYTHLKNTFSSNIPINIAAPKQAPVEIISFERETEIEVTFGGGYNVVRNYDYIDFNNDGVNEFMAKAIRVPALDSLCANTHLVKVDKYGKNDYTNTDILNKVSGNVGQCGNRTFYFRYNNEFFIKTNNKIFTVQGDNLVIVAERYKSFKVNEITYQDE